jgi:hypothetical protein
LLKKNNSYLFVRKYNISLSYQMLGSHDSNFGILIPSKIMWVQFATWLYYI